jgi:hypothetical protein
MRTVAILTADDFLTGLFASLALQGRTRISIRSDDFDRAVSVAYTRLKERASQEGINVRFRVKPDPIHGDSATVRDSIARAAQRRLISLNNPEYQDITLELAKRQPELLLNNIPGGRHLFDELAGVFLRSFEPPIV